MNSDAILDGRLWPRIGLDYAPAKNLEFQTNDLYRGHFASQLLLYDKIILPTNDFGIIPVLINWLGYEAFRSAVETESLAFLRQKGVLGYVGNGNGVQLLIVMPGANTQAQFQWWQEAMFGDMDVAAELQLRTCSSLTSKERQKLLQGLLAQSSEFRYEDETFKKNIYNETYIDIMSSPEMSHFVLSHEEGNADKIDLTRLQGVDPNQVRISSIGPLGNSVDLVLRVAELNLEIAMSVFLGGTDLFAADGANHVLQQKIARSGLTTVYAEGFCALLELNNLPNIEAAVVKNQISLAEVWEIRQKNASKKFRKWLKNAGPRDARELEKAYVAALSSQPIVASFPMRALRLFITSAVSLAQPVLGFVAGGIDNLFVEKWMSGYTPKLFFDDLRKLELPK